MCAQGMAYGTGGGGVRFRLTVSHCLACSVALRLDGRRQSLECALRAGHRRTATACQAEGE